MPEGQVSHRNAVRFTAALVGHELVRVEAPEPRLAAQRIPERLAGDRVTGGRGGRQAPPAAIRERPRAALAPHDERRVAAGCRRRGPPRRGGLFLALWTERPRRLALPLPQVRLLEPGEPLPRGLTRDRSGPARPPPSTPARGRAARLARLEPTRQVGDALMDQRVVAGIGNVYKSETCFLTGIDPWRPVGTPQPPRRPPPSAPRPSRLLAEGVRDGGADPHLAPAGRAARGAASAPGSTAAAAGRAGAAAPRVRSRGQGDANRTTYWCPACQT